MRRATTDYDRFSEDEPRYERREMPDDEFDRRLDEERDKETERRTDHTSLTVPWSHQVTATKMIVGLRGALLGLDMGTGKTLCVINAITALDCRRVLIICPKAVLPTWPAEFAKHTNLDLTIDALDQTGTGKKASFARVALDVGDACALPVILVVNY